MQEGKGERAEAAMLLGKRPRASMRRTTSMTELSLEDLAAAAEGGEGIRRHHRFHHREWRKAAASEGLPRIAQRRNCGDFGTMETTRFLMACGLCNRCLGPGHDIFIYRGEIAFCSLECRQHKMNQDELKDKINDASSTTASEMSVNGQTAVAA